MTTVMTQALFFACLVLGCLWTVSSKPATSEDLQQEDEAQQAIGDGEHPQDPGAENLLQASDTDAAAIGGEWKEMAGEDSNDQYLAEEQYQADQQYNAANGLDDPNEQDNANEQLSGGLEQQGSDWEAEGSEREQQQQQYEGGNVEELVHGDAHVHDSSLEHQNSEGERNKEQVGTLDTEHLAHAERHGDHDHRDEAEPDDAIKEAFKAGDVEQMIHGEGHVHDSDAGGAGRGDGGDTLPYKVGDIDVLALASLNVHDPASRARVAGDLDDLLQPGRGMGGREDEGPGGGQPTVMDGEHLMHGEGGHDHDIKQLKFLKTKEEAAAAGQDPFADVHKLLMHSDHDDDHAHDDDHKIRRGKTITYKDIMALGLDEDLLKGIDLNKLLLENAREYDDWQREKEVMQGESPEVSFWEQVGEIRRRYLSFGRNDGEARDLTGTKLDPAEQQWVAGIGVGEGEGNPGDEDDVLHQLEILGSTAPKQDRHKHSGVTPDEYHENGRDVTDL